MRPEDAVDTSKTIAVKRNNRLSKKVEEIRNGRRIVVVGAWWSTLLVEILGLALISILNFYLIYPLLGGADKGTFFSGPVFPFLGKVLAWLFRVPFTEALNLTTIFFFLFFPTSFSILIYFLTGRRLVALFAVLAVMLPEYVFVESRIASGLYFGDGPHIASLTIAPLAIYALILFLRHGGRKNLVMSAFLSSVIVLTSPFGFTTYLIFALIAAFSEMLLGHGRLKLMRFVFIFVLAAAMVSFWYNPAFAVWLVFGPMGKEVRDLLWSLLPLSFFALPVLATFGYLLFDRRPNLQPVFLGFFWTAVFLVMFLVAERSIATPASRYLPELGIALSFLIGVGLTALVDALKMAKIALIPALNKPAFSNPAITLLLVILIAAVILPRGRLISDMKALENVENNLGRGRYWLERENYGGTAAILGYLISGGTIVTLFYMERKARRAK